MIFKKIYIVFLLFFGNISAQYISTNETYTAQQLVENVLINSGCASVSNVTVSGGNFSGGEKSWGYFNANGSSFPFEDGIILSTGKIANAPGPNTSILEDGNGIGWIGDVDLNVALNISNSLNATILEFDFIPLGEQISFDYIFSSEQYLTNPSPSQCSFTDGFCFLIKEAGSANLYENLAVIPNTNIPVKVDTVRGLGTICPAANTAYFGGFNDIEHPTNFNGQTKTLTARTNVTPGVQYHIKLVIADEGNYRYDSAIFLKGSSFSIGADLGPDRSFANQNPVCSNESISINGTSTGVQSYQWFFNGNPIPGQNTGILSLNPPYNSAQNGTYSLSSTYSPTCITNDEIVIDFFPQLVIGQTSYTYCDNDGQQDGIRSVLLNEIIPTLFPNLPANSQVNFYESASSTTPLSSFFQLTTPFQQTIYARINNNNCDSNIPVTINVLVFTDPITNDTVEICNSNEITLTADSGYPTYTWNTGETSQSIQVSSPGNYTVTIGNANSCTKNKTITVVSSEAATITNIITNDFSDNNTIEIVVTGNGDYEYSLNGTTFQDSPIFTQFYGIDFTAYVRDKKGCGLTTQEFSIIQIPAYFTPNGDGFNDTWQIKNLINRGLGQSIICIYDRFGKLLKQFSGSGEGWDGTFNGQLLPADDYWYTISNNNNLLKRGHFTLKR